MARSKKPQRGRPPLPAGQAASERIVVLVQPETRERWQAAAEERGVAVGELVRQSVEAAIK